MEGGHHIASRITDRQAAEVQNTAQPTVNCDEVVALQIAMYPYSGNLPWRDVRTEARAESVENATGVTGAAGASRPGPGVVAP